MPKIPLSVATGLSKTPRFFEAIRLNYGSYFAAQKALGIPAKMLRSLAERSRSDAEDYKASDATLKAIQRGVSKMPPAYYKLSNDYVMVHSQLGMTKGQVEYAKQYTAKAGKEGEKARRYFRKSTREFFNKNLKHVHMGAIDPRTGKSFQTSPSKRNVRRGSKRAIRRRRR